MFALTYDSRQKKVGSWKEVISGEYPYFRKEMLFLWCNYCNTIVSLVKTSRCVFSLEMTMGWKEGLKRYIPSFYRNSLLYMYLVLRKLNTYSMWTFASSKYSVFQRNRVQWHVTDSYKNSLSKLLTISGFQLHFNNVIWWCITYHKCLLM